MSLNKSLGKHLSKGDAVALLVIADDCLRVGSRDDFSQVLRKLSVLLHFECANTNLVTLQEDLSVERLVQQVPHKFPETWSKVYRARNLAKIDPIARLLFRSQEPIFWSDIRAQCQDGDSQRFYKLAADHGLHDGFSFGVRYPGSNRASLFTVSGRCLKSPGPRERGIAAWVMPHLHAALGRIHFSRPDLVSQLNEGELQVLACVRRGKTNTEIALQLDLSPRTVKFRIEQAMHKLQANTRSEAVSLALMHRLID